MCPGHFLSKMLTGGTEMMCTGHFLSKMLTGGTEMTGQGISQKSFPKHCIKHIYIDIQYSMYLFHRSIVVIFHFLGNDTFLLY